MKKVMFLILIIILFIPSFSKIEISVNGGVGLNFFNEYFKDIYGLINPSYNLEFDIQMKHWGIYLGGDYLHQSGSATKSSNNIEYRYAAKLQTYSYRLGIRYMIRWKVQPYVGVSLGRAYYKENWTGIEVPYGGFTSSGWSLFLSIEPGVRYQLNNIYLDLKFSPVKHHDMNEGWMSDAGFIFSVGYLLVR